MARRLLILFPAGATKKRRTEDIIEADTLCEQCLQRNRRIESCKEEINKLSSEEEYQMLTYKKKLEEYNNKKDLLRTLISPDMFRFVEEYVEGVPQLDMLSQLNQNSFLTGTSTVPKQFLLQLMDYFFGNTRNETVSIAPSTLRIEDLLQAVRRPAAGPSPDMLRSQLSLFDLLTSSATKRLTEEKSPGAQASVPVSTGYMQPAVAPYSAMPQPQPSAPAAPPPALASAQPTTYPSYQPTVPPPKNYHPFSAQSTSSQSVTYCQIRMDQSSHLSHAAPMPAASNKKECHPYGMGIYSGPRYYQPYQ